MRQYIAPLFALSLILQGSLFSFPLAFLFLTISAVKKKGKSLFPVAFILGLVLDSFYFKTLGTTSIFFLLFLFAVFTYERKFEIDNSTFIFISTFLGSMTLFLILGEPSVLLKTFIAAAFAIFLSKLW